jgi:hypothetical protein
MDIEPTEFNKTLPNEKSKGSLIVAVLLGLLTFVITGILAAIIIIVLLPFKINLAALLLYGAWGGYAAIQFGLFALFILLGDVATAVVSWFVNHSKKLASVTFVSALIFQIVALAIIIPTTLKKSQETMNAGIAQEESYEQYAVIEDVKVEPQEPFKFTYALNGKLTEALLFKKLVFTIPISVSHAGPYEINIQYTSNSNFYANSNSPSTVKQVLNVGTNTVKIEFVAGNAPNLGYELPSSVKGDVIIQLNYLASKKELLDSLKSDSNVDQKVLQQFMKDEGLDQGVSSDSTVNKFVERKEIQF